MNNEQLVALIQDGIDTADNMLKLWKQNQGMIRKLANKYSTYAELEDLQQEGYIGLCNAIDGYNPDEGPFINYAILWIRQAMRRHIENALEEYNQSTRSAMKMASRVNELNDIATAFAKEYEREAKPNELAQRMGITEEEVKELMKVSLDAIAVLDQGKIN